MPSEDKIAGAPISWGVCEVPGWGYQLQPDRVLAEMREVGLGATELGPDGFLPSQPRPWPGSSTGTTSRPSAGSPRCCCTCPPMTRSPRSTGCWTPTPLRVRACWCCRPSPAWTATTPGRSRTTTAWRVLLGNLDRLAALAASRGVRAVLHPHVGTMVENGAEVQRVLEGSSVDLCLDTGHLLIGGTDPAELARQAPERVAHVHFKDVDARLARRVQGGRLTYTQGVRDGMYRPLGSGDVDVPAIVGSLHGRGYDGWYVLEQDTILTEEPAGEGPVADVWASAEHLRGVLARTG